jgi:hypothetical protein
MKTASEYSTHLVVIYFSQNLRATFEWKIWAAKLKIIGEPDWLLVELVVGGSNPRNSNHFSFIKK